MIVVILGRLFANETTSGHRRRMPKRIGLGKRAPRWATGRLQKASANGAADPPPTLARDGAHDIADHELS
jgi:hypothetical protein